MKMFIFNSLAQGAVYLIRKLFKFSTLKKSFESILIQPWSENRFNLLLYLFFIFLQSSFFKVIYLVLV